MAKENYGMFQVKDLSKYPDGRVIAEVFRHTRQHKGWESVTYKGKRYQVFGGIRNPEFIDISHPIVRRKN